MVSRIGLLSSLAALYFACAQQSIHAATIAFGMPSAGQNYAVGAPISYSGSGSWTLGAEPMTSAVAIDLLYWPVGSGSTIVESDTPVLTYTYSGGVYTGSYSFANSVDANNNSNLVATQYKDANGQTYTNYYTIRATPLKKGLPYTVNGNIILAYRNLGTIQ